MTVVAAHSDVFVKHVYGQLLRSRCDGTLFLYILFRSPALLCVEVGGWDFIVPFDDIFVQQFWASNLSLVFHQQEDRDVIIYNIWLFYILPLTQAFVQWNDGAMRWWHMKTAVQRKRLLMRRWPNVVGNLCLSWMHRTSHRVSLSSFAKLKNNTWAFYNNYKIEKHL